MKHDELELAQKVQRHWRHMLGRAWDFPADDKPSLEAMRDACGKTYGGRETYGGADCAWCRAFAKGAGETECLGCPMKSVMGGICARPNSWYRRLCNQETWLNWCALVEVFLSNLDLYIQGLQAKKPLFNNTFVQAPMPLEDRITLLERDFNAQKIAISAMCDMENHLTERLGERVEKLDARIDRICTRIATLEHLPGHQPHQH